MALWRLEISSPRGKENGGCDTIRCDALRCAAMSATFIWLCKLVQRAQLEEQPTNDKWLFSYIKINTPNARIWQLTASQTRPQCKRGGRGGGAPYNVEWLLARVHKIMQLFVQTSSTASAPQPRPQSRPYERQRQRQTTRATAMTATQSSVLPAG